MFRKPFKMSGLGTGLALSALLASLLGCMVSAGIGAATPSITPQAPTPSQTVPARAIFRASDALDDCFSEITGHATDCDGLDLTEVVIGLPGELPDFNDEPVMAGRLDVVISYAEDQTNQPVTSLGLMVDLDQDPTTGVDMTDQGGIAGIDRGFFVEIPADKYYYSDYSVLGWDAPIVTDNRLFTVIIRGNRVGMAIDPSLLEDFPGAFPDGFAVYISGGRGFGLMDHFNGDGPLTKGLRLVVPDKVVTQVH